MRRLNEINIPARNVVIAILLISQLVIWVSFLTRLYLPWLPEIMITVFDMCAIYIVAMVIRQKEGKNYLPSILFIISIAVLTTLLVFVGN